MPCQLDPQPGERLLDVGCGTGWFTRMLAGGPGLDVTRIDIDTATLAFARNRDRHATYLPSGSRAARVVERCLPTASPFGSFLLFTGDRNS